MNQLTSKILRDNADAMDVYAAGKPVEWTTPWSDTWLPTKNPTWDFASYKYRPVREPEIVPWSLEKHPFGAVFVRQKGDTMFLIITQWGQDWCNISGWGIEKYPKLLSDFEHIDDDEVKPCGYYK